MNKARRHEIKMLKYKKRLKNYGVKDSDNWYSLRSHGTPCSCGICRGSKYSRKTKHKKNNGL